MQQFLSECKPPSAEGRQVQPHAGAVSFQVLAWFQFVSLWVAGCFLVALSVTQKNARHKCRSFCSKFFTHMKGAWPSYIFPQMKL